MMKKIRIYELASKLKQESLDLINVAKILKIDVTSHLSTITSEEQLALVEYYTQNKKSKKKYFSKTVPSVTEEKSPTENNVITPEIKNKIKDLASKVETVDDLVSLVNAINNFKYGKNNHLNFKKKQFTYYAFYAKSKYKKFTIPKKSGGQREVLAPSKGLKHILSALNIVFQSVYKSHMVCHGFTQYRSVVTNAKNHVGKNYVYNIDLENFFPSIYQARIWKRLQYPPFNFNLDVANLVSNLVCYQYKITQYTLEKIKHSTSFSSVFEQSVENNINFLPQGAPTSPILSNIVCERLDRKLFKLAKKHNLKYTRYADDMTFSSDHNVYQEDSEFLNELKKIIKEENFQINHKKTRLQKRGYRQEVTGLVVNDKVNVSRRYVKDLRMLIHLLNKYGEEKAQKIFAKHYRKDKGIKAHVPNIHNVISGKLEYLKMVKNYNDDCCEVSTYAKLLKKYNQVLESGKEIEEKPKNVNSQGTNPEEDKEIVDKYKHNPKRLVEILSKFRDSNSPFKASVHSEIYLDSEDDGGYGGNYNKFHSALKKEYNLVKEELKKLSSRIDGKIYAFLLSQNLGTKKDSSKYFYTWGDNQVRFGWSSSELKKWCISSKDHNPFSFKIPEELKKTRTDISITSFQDVTKIFKDEIEVRDDNDALIELIENLEVELKNSDDGFILEYRDEDIMGKTFFTDFHWLSKGIRKIFKTTSDNAKQNGHKKIRITMEKINNDIELRIIHEHSKSKKDPKTLLKESFTKGDFNDIKKYFCSLCDWSIESTNKNVKFRINFLKSEKVEDIEYLDKNIDGFIHVLRFYK